MRRAAPVLLLVAALAVVSGCTSVSGTTTVATVDGTDIDRSALDELHPDGADVDAHERASSMLLLILHELLPTAARHEFDVSIADGQRDAAFAARTSGLGPDVDATLRERGVTRDRVRLEADLDALRDELEPVLVREEAPGYDFDAAYRTFLSVNSRVCVSALQVTDDARLSAIEALVDAGADLEAVEDAHADQVERIEVDCGSPRQLPPGLASVALDGDTGDTHVVRTDGGAYVATVDSRDAPRADDVLDEVRAVAVETQGPELFDTWAAEVIRSAEVDLDRSVGRWAATDGTGGVPTVVAD